MKKTELKGVYCVPKTEDEMAYFKCSPNCHIAFVGISYEGHNGLSYNYERVLGLETIKDRTEIPVSKFIDLLEDRIVGWRLEEIGFEYQSYIDEGYHINLPLILEVEMSMKVWLEGHELNIKTFTELETLIRFLK